MDSHAGERISNSSPVRQNGVAVLWVAAVALAVWGPLIFKLRIDWSTNAQYEFGLFIPFFIAFLFFQRWKDSPEAKPPGNRLWTWLAISLALVLVLPIRVIQEANPEWRPLNWLHAALVVAVTLLLLRSVGGWKWAWHFTPCLMLVFFALPWTLTIEQTVIQWMARMVTAVTTELLNCFGIPALQDGNVIRVPAGPVGVKDACSGVRSLAGTLMAAYFFGEFCRLSWWKRCVLLAGGVSIAFVLNLVRTFTLGWVAATQGIEAISRWHDQTGLLIFVVAFGALWLLAEKLNAGRPDVNRRNSKGLSSISMPRTVCFAILVWSLGVEGITEAWYRSRERNLPHFSTWNPVWPTDNPSLTFVPIPDEARAILRYSEGYSAVLEELGEPSWQMIFIRWEPGRSSSQLAVLHRPDICLPATGLKFVSRGEGDMVDVGGLSLPFESFIFDSSGVPLYVFRTLCEDRRTPGSTSGFDQSIAGRVQSAWAGRRNLGQKLLQIAILGPETQQAALENLQARLPRFLNIRSLNE